MTPPHKTRGEKEFSPRLQLGNTQSITGLLVKIVFLGLVAGITIAFVPTLVAGRQWTMLAAFIVGAVAIFAIYSTKRAIPAKYLFPGTAFLTLFIVVPIILTLQISTTNYGDGTRTSKQDTIDTLISQSMSQRDDSEAFVSTVVRTNPGGKLAVFLVKPTSGTVFRGDSSGLSEVSEQGLSLQDNKVTQASGYSILNAGDTNRALAELGDLDLQTSRGGEIVFEGISNAYEGFPTLSYDAATDTITNTETGTQYQVTTVGDREYFVDAAGQKLSDQSWTSSVGLGNFQRIFTEPSIRNNLMGAFTWTLFFAVFSVGATFVLGLIAAVAYNDQRVRFLKIQRSLMIIPYAVPTFIGFLVWSTFFNKDFGLINQILGTHISWLGDPFWAKVAVCIANLWAGFPYMFLITTGALQSLPDDIGEAAQIDGAGPIQAFVRIKFPLLMVAVAPLLVSSFAFNFNNYNAIALLTKGGPFTSDGSAFGATDILISGVFRLAFGEKGAELGFAAAFSVLLFLVTAIMAIVQFRYTKVLEDVN